MQWIADLVARLGSHGAYANASSSLASEREEAVRIERFLVRFDHPAGRDRVPSEPPARETTRVA